MNNTTFINNLHVAEFVKWLIEELPRIKISLNISKSRRFAPNGVKAECNGFEEVLAHYAWAGDWTHNKTTLSTLANTLRNALNEDNPATLTACLEVLRWGGVRGAVAFLTDLSSRKLLVNYLKTRSPLLSLTGTQSLSQLNPEIINKFDAGMTKIYSLIDNTGSPIYDSRVGAAMAMLYQCFIHSQKEDKNALLNFPSGSARGKQIRNPGALGTEFFNAPQFYTRGVEPHIWAQFQLKLGWIIQDILNKTKWFDKEGNIADRCRAFEACLFMIGYDLRAISGNTICNPTGIITATENQPVKLTTIANQADPTNTGWVPSGHPFKKVLQYFLEFRNLNPDLYSLESFRNWLIQEKNYQETTARAYEFPLREREFDLLDRTIEDLECIALGGQAGLECVLRDRTLDVDERAWVCMVDAWIVGKLFESEDREAILIRAGFAGTENACSTLLSVGKAVGQHFGLLNENGSPTQLYEDTFSDHMDELEETLSEAKKK